MLVCVVQIFVAACLTKLCASSTEYVIADGIKVSRLDFESARDEEDSETLDLQSEERLLEHKLQMKEKITDRQEFPNKCQVCRLFVEELLRFLHKNGEVHLERDGQTPIYIRNGNVMYRAMQEVCPEMKNYRVSRIRHFRYVRGGSTPLREAFNEVQGKSRVKKWMYSFPESELDDPTGEVKRLEAQCETLVEAEEERIINWFFKKQTKEPWKWLCADRVLKKEVKDCLDQSTDIKPKYAEKIEENARASFEEKKSSNKKTQDSFSF